MFSTYRIQVEIFLCEAVSHIQSKSGAAFVLKRLIILNAWLLQVNIPVSLWPLLLPMTICKYYQAGRCKFGNDCKFEHVGPTASTGRPPADPFSRTNKSNKSETRPLWPLSAVANPDKPNSGNIVDADVSPEELRLMAYHIAPRGQSASAVQKEAALVAEHRAKANEATGRGNNSHSTTSNAGQQNVNDPFNSFQNSHQQESNGPFATPGAMSGMEVANSPTFNTHPPLEMNGNPFGRPQGTMDAFPGAGLPQPSQLVGHALPQTESQPQLAPLVPQQPMPQLNQQFDQHQSNNNASDQFSASHFTFEKVPETAPLPQFY